VPWVLGQFSTFESVDAKVPYEFASEQVVPVQVLWPRIAMMNKY
jgi:hypothetical protein